MVMINDQDGLREWECRYIYNHGPKGISTGWKTSCCVASLLGRPIGRSFGTRRQMVIYQGGGGWRFPFSFLSIFRIIKPIYDDIPFPSAFQKSISGVF